MYKLIDDCTTSKAAIFEEPLGEDREDAIRTALAKWEALSSSDQRRRDGFYVEDESGNTANIKEGPYEYILNYWNMGRGCTHRELWDTTEYFMPAEVFLDETFIDRDDAVGSWNDGVSIEVCLEGVLLDEYFYTKEDKP